MRGHLVDHARFLHSEHLRIFEPAADAAKQKRVTKMKAAQNIPGKLVHRAHEAKQCNGA
jgi:hypothetical protein